MNLAKNGAVLLAALSVFAMTSCGGTKEKKVDLEAAKAFLKNVDEAKAKSSKIEYEVFEWKTTTTGEGMANSEDGKKIGGAPFMLAYLVYENEPSPKEMNRVVELALKKEFCKLDSQFKDDKKINTFASEQQLAFMNATDIEGIASWGGVENVNYYTSDSTLRISFDRTENIKAVDVTINMKQTINIKKDGFVKNWSVKVKDQELKYKAPLGPDIEIDCNGTLSGTITSYFTYQK